MIIHMDYSAAISLLCYSQDYYRYTANYKTSSKHSSSASWFDMYCWLIMTTNSSFYLALTIGCSLRGHLELFYRDLDILVSGFHIHLMHRERCSDIGRHFLQFEQNRSLIESHYFRYLIHYCLNDGRGATWPLSMSSQWIISRLLRLVPCWLRTLCLFWLFWHLRHFFCSCSILRRTGGCWSRQMMFSRDCVANLLQPSDYVLFVPERLSSTLHMCKIHG